MYKGNMTPKDVPMQLWSSDSRYPYYQYANTIVKNSSRTEIDVVFDQAYFSATVLPKILF